jgi:2-methylfumaryl-CoA isomerase
MYDLLSPLRVVEAASFIAAPTAGLYLGQFGAEVIRIDQIGGGPDFRRWPLSGGGASFYWEGLNKGKKSVAIDLSRPEGRELMTELIAAPGDQGGLFLTNFPVGGFLEHSRLAERRRDLITTRIMGAADGTPAFDYTVNCALGYPYLTGPASLGEQPVNHVLPAWDLMTGAYAAFSMLAAERRRRETGEGQEMRVPLSDVGIATFANLGQLAEGLQDGDRARLGNDVYGVLGRDFRTRDGQRIMIMAITARQWTGLVEALEIGDAISGLEAKTGVSFARDEGLRFEHRDTLLPMIETVVASRDLVELGTALTRLGCCWGPYQSMAEAARSESMVGQNPIFSSLHHPSGQTYPAPGAMATIPQLERTPAIRAPHLGEHTDQILADVLGLSSGAIGELHDRGLVADERGK